MGTVDFASMPEVPLVSVPVPFKYGFNFDWVAFVPVAVIFLVSPLEAAGDLTANSMISRQPVKGPLYIRRIKSGLLADGLNSAMAAVFNSMPMVTFAQNNGVIQLTGVASRYVAFFIAGLLVLLWPLMQSGSPASVFLALGSALSWAAGIVYLKWTRVSAHPIAITAWQLVAGLAAVAVGMLAYGVDTSTPIPVSAMIGLAYSTLVGTALAYLLWFQCVARLPASTAGLGTLMVPVIGVIASMLLLGDRPSAADLGGFALIFLAALCALGPRTLQRA